jgi:outer membrane receptor for ferrienterochelin and colicins
LVICAAGVVGLHAQTAEKKPDATDSDLDALGQIQVESIYSASKYEQKVTKAAASASIVTRDEIQKFGHRTITDVLRSIRGFNVSYDRNYGYIGLRGFLRPGDYTTRVLVLIDGHRMNDNLYDSGMLGLDAFVDIDMVERVEVVRGPGSAIYGSNAFFGVVNIVTRRGADINGAEISGAYGSFDTYKGRFTYGNRFANGVELAVSGTYFDSKGNDALYYSEFGGTAFNSDEEYSRFLFGSLSYHGLTLEGNLNWREKNIPTASFGTIFNDGRETTWDTRSFVELRYETPADAETGVLAKISYDDYQYHGVYYYDYGIGAPVLNHDKLLGQWVSPEINLRRTFWDRLTAEVGADARINVTQHLLNYDQDPYFLYRDFKETADNFGVYGQADLEVLKSLNVVGGLRYDYFEEVGGSLSPRGGIIWSPAADTTLKFLYGQAFRAPNRYEQTYNGTPGDQIKPEKIHTFEAVVDQYFLKNYRIGLSAYRFDVDGIISQVPDSAGTFHLANSSEITGMGAEAEFEARFSNGILGRASYAIQRAEDADGVELSNSPRNLVKTGLILPVWRNKIFSGAEMQYTSSARTLYGTRTGDFVILNWTLYGRELLPGLDASVSVYNLLDQRYGYPGAADHVQSVIQQDGRSFRLKLTYRF